MQLNGVDSLADIASAVAVEFGQAIEDVRDDLSELIPELRSEGLIALR